MKIIFSLIICITANLLQAQEQVKKGKWMVSHDVFGLGYEKQTIKIYSNDVYAGKQEYGTFHTSLLFQSPYWGNSFGSSSKKENYNAAGDQVGEEKANSFSISLKPSIGYFIRDRLLVGAELNFYVSNSKNDYSTLNDEEVNKIRYMSIGLAPHIRYYFGPLKGKQLFHAGVSGGIDYGTVKQDYTDNGTTNTYKSKNPVYHVQPYIGSSWFAGKRWTLAASLCYRLESYSYTTDYGNTSGKNESKANDIFLSGLVGYSF